MNENRTFYIFEKQDGSCSVIKMFASSIDEAVQMLNLDVSLEDGLVIVHVGRDHNTYLIPPKHSGNLMFAYKVTEIVDDLHENSYIVKE